MFPKIGVANQKLSQVLTPCLEPGFSLQSFCPYTEVEVDLANDDESDVSEWGVSLVVMLGV